MSSRYSATFQLTVYQGVIPTEILVSTFSALTNIPREWMDIFSSPQEILLYDTIWESHDEHMIALSLSFPNVIFELHGEGKNSGDLWNCYYANGKMQVCRAEIWYPECDPEQFITLDAALELNV